MIRCVELCTEICGVVKVVVPLHQKFDLDMKVCRSDVRIHRFRGYLVCVCVYMCLFFLVDLGQCMEFRQTLVSAHTASPRLRGHQ